MTAQYAAWKRSGPPLNIAAVAIAAALGIKLVDDPKSEATGEDEIMQLLASIPMVQR